MWWALANASAMTLDLSVLVVYVVFVITLRKGGIMLFLFLMFLVTCQNFFDEFSSFAIVDPKCLLRRSNMSA